MSSQPFTTTPGGGAASVAANHVSRTRVTIVASTLALGSAAVAAVLLWHPGPARNDFSYSALAPVRDAAWLGLLIDSIGFSAATIGLSIAVCLLTPARGAVGANVGAVLTTLGGAVFASVTLAYGVLGWYITATDAIPAESGAALLRYYQDHAGHLAGPEVAAFLALNAGVLLLALALWRARAVPRWLPITMAVLTLAQFAVPATRVLDAVQAAVMATFIAVAWFARAAATRPSAD